MKIIVENQDGIEEVLDSNVIRLDDNDVIVLKIENTTNEIKVISEKMREAFPNNKTVILPKGSSLDILKQTPMVVDMLSHGDLGARKVLKG